MLAMGAARNGIVIFSGDAARLARFYAGVTGLPSRHDEAGVAVLASDAFELVLHALPGEAAGKASRVRADAYVKPVFAVPLLADARARVRALGGAMAPAADEWEGRGFRACEAVDPDGNVFQLREDAER